MKTALNKITCWRTWLRGLIAAAVGGGANAITAMGIKPEDFNFGAGLPDLMKFAGISALISAALYLKQSPIPPEQDEEPSDISAHQ